MWNVGFMDAPAARYKDTLSTDYKAMDADKLIKRDAPDAFKKMMSGPLYKTVFRLMQPKDEHLKHFWVNPSDGELGFSTFSSSENSVEDVIGEILKHN